VRNSQLVTPDSDFLAGVNLPDVLEKRRHGQALNLKEFAVAARVSYSVAREWAQITGFPRFEGVIFWEDFEEWRKERNQMRLPNRTPLSEVARESERTFTGLPARAAKILETAVKN